MENFLSQKVIVKEGLVVQPSSIGAYTVDGHDVRIYGRHTCETHARDARGDSRSSMQQYLATDIKHYDAILGYPWLASVDPEILWKKAEWSYRRNDISIEQVSVETFHAESAGAPVYAIYVQPANSMRDKGAVLYSTDVVDHQLPKEYKDYGDVFSEEV